jgi:hypothetical protein
MDEEKVHVLKIAEQKKCKEAESLLPSLGVDMAIP